ncbi:MAG: hypothetical protein JRN39_02990, partial [Nitrososphaerota archaeon]|nr:hypothetical protein [Nitrososphaerota archaeon]
YDESHGHSEVVDYTGKVMVEAESTGECAIRVAIDVDRLRRTRTKSNRNFLSMLPTEMYAGLYGRTKVYPTDAFAAGPIKEVAEYDPLMRKIRSGLLKERVLVEP